MQAAGAVTRWAIGFVASAGVASGVVLGAPALADILSSDGPRASAQSPSGLDRQFARLPLRFEANQGQAPDTVDFLARGPGYTMAISPAGAVLALSGGKASTVRAAGRSAVVGMHLVGGNPSPTATTGARLPGVSNYIVGADRKGWRTAVPSYARIRYHEVYRGIDLVYRGNQKELEYDLIVAAGADPAKIAVGFRGARRLSITSTGDLLIHSRDGVIRQRRPVVY
ncbi:MAG TPA: hypothetical protein VNT54_19030, partial [Solirubrobacteraceae bacterium]|nr:hypothetical protein [Solirubrobacteraceae bacterium]